MKDSSKTVSLGKDSIPSLMWKFSVPCVISLLVSALYNIVDQVFIGNSELSALGNAATGLAFPFFIMAQSFAFCLGDGCAAFLNICQGKKDTKTAERAVGTSITVILLLSFLLIGVLYPFKTQLLLLFGASENNLPYATEYLMVILAFFPFYMLANMLNGVIRADGAPSWAMISLIVGAVLNMALDPLFIFGFHWGMTGAALATGIAQLCSTILSVLYLFRTKTFHLTLRSFLPDFKAFVSPLNLGVSSFVTQVTILVISILSNVMLARYGAESAYGMDVPIAVMAVEGKVFNLILSFVVGIVLGSQPIVSYNMGAQKYDRVRKTFRLVLFLTLGIGIVSTLFFQLMPRGILALFGDASNLPNPDDYWQFGCKTFRIFLSLVTFTCVIKMNAIFFQAVAKPFRAVVASMIRDIICFVPLVIVLPLFFGVEGILYAAPIADFIAMAVTVALTWQFFHRLPKH